MKVLSFLLSAIFAISLFIGGAPTSTFAADKKEVVKAGSGVATKVAAGKTAQAKTKAKAVPENIDINAATAETLCLIPGIGPKTAEAIIKQRNSVGQFKSVDDLLAVKGIGEKSLLKIKPYLQKI